MLLEIMRAVPCSYACRKAPIRLDGGFFQLAASLGYYGLRLMEVGGMLYIFLKDFEK